MSRPTRVDRDLGSIAQEIEKKISQMKIPEGFHGEPEGGTS